MSSDQDVPTGDNRSSDSHSDQAARPRRLIGISLWVWLLLLLLGFAVVLIALDLRNRDRYRLRCRADSVAFERGRRLPSPIGFGAVGGMFRPIPLPPQANCKDQDFRDRQQAETAFLEIALAGVQQAVLGASAQQLGDLRPVVHQLMQITRRDAHAAQRKEALALMADLAYREGRAGLDQLEMGLRQALTRLREAKQFAERRYDDLEDWIEHIDALLRAIAPPPGSALGRSTPLLAPSVPLSPPPVPSESSETPTPLPSDITPAPETPTAAPEELETKPGVLM